MKTLFEADTIPKEILNIIQELASIPALSDETEYRDFLASDGRDNINDAYNSGYLDGKIMLARQLLNTLDRL
jgi:hypothetical protein